MSFYCEQVQPNGMVMTTEHRPEFVSTWTRIDDVSFGASKTKRSPVYIPETGNFTHDANFDVSWTTPWAEHWDGLSPWVLRDFAVSYGGPPSPHPSTKGQYLVRLAFVETARNTGEPCPLLKFPPSSYLSVVATFAVGNDRVNVVGHDGVCVQAPLTVPIVGISGMSARAIKAEYIFEGSSMPYRNQLKDEPGKPGTILVMPDTRKPPRRVVRRPRFVDPQIEA